MLLHSLFPKYFPRHENQLETKNHHEHVQTMIRENIHRRMVNTQFQYIGKKRNTRTLHDVYETHERDKLVYVATDRQTTFNNRVLVGVPFKGQAVNQLSQWWFDQTKHIADNTIVCTPDPRVNIIHKSQTLPFDLMVRQHQRGTNVVVPIPKWGNRFISEHDLISSGVLTESEWETVNKQWRNAG